MVSSVKIFSTKLPALLGFLALTLFSFSTSFGQETSRQKVNLKDIGSLQADLHFYAGTFELGTQNRKEADMQFSYTREAWKPEIQLDTRSGQGRLTVKQGDGKNVNMRDKDRNKWEMMLPESLVTDLKIRMGAGEGNMNFNGARINRFELEAGAGEFNVNLANTSVQELNISAGVGSLTLDLSGERTNNLHAKINGGIGDLKVLFPEEVGVRVKVNGLGGLDSDGFKKQDGYYVNSAYGKTPYSIEVTVNGGLGSLEMALHSAAY